MLIPVVVLVTIFVFLNWGPVLYYSDRVGQDNTVFRLIKFRTMKVAAPIVATHLLHDPEQWITPIGALLRRTSFDEIPQKWNVLKGEMSLVGPRPALCTQVDLICLRTKAGVHRLKPGITGWAQINGRDNLSLSKKVAYDLEYLKRQSVLFDIRILVLTTLKVLRREGVRH